MERIIRIDGKDYHMASSALTQFSYKNETGRSFLRDLKEIISISKKKDLENDIEAIDDISELLLKMSYVMVKEADKNQYISYEDFLKSIDNLYDDKDWIFEVIGLAVTPLSRNLQTNKGFQ